MSNYESLTPDFSKGLLPVILQHALNKEIRMVGYMNEEAFELTKKEEVVWFYSRSKDRLWKKGESSGHIQKVKDKVEVANEAADVLYHLGVLLHASGVSVSDVEAVLASRHQTQNNFKGERSDVENW